MYIKRIIKNKFTISVFMVLFLFSFFSISSAETIDPVKKWAWADQLGWVNFNPTQGGVRVFNQKLNGYFWIENGGWVKLNPENGGVLNRNGDLSGFAWGSNIGWVNFSSVNIDPNTGFFSGIATTENTGSINFNGDNISVRTSWRGPFVGLNGINEKRFRGYAWSDNIGWISMNCSNTRSCDYINYGVDVDAGGIISGLAWSDNIGWLDFSYYNNARIDWSNGKLTGDIQFLAALAEDDQWDGKVVLSSSSAPQFGPILDLGTYEVDGFSWGSDVVGWIDFKTDNSTVTIDPFRFLFTANKGLSPDDYVSYNSSFILSWTTQGSVSCVSSDGGSTNWSDTPTKPTGEPTTATHTINNIDSDTLFVLTCRDSSGNTIRRELTILVRQPAPSVIITTNDTNIRYNTKSTLNWVTENISSCQASGDWTGTKAIGTQSELTANLTNPVNVFHLDCISNFIIDYPDLISDSIQVDVEKLKLNFYADKNPVPFGDKAKIFWDTEFATACVASGNLPGFSGNVSSNDGLHFFEESSASADEGRQYSVSLICQGSASQSETRSIQFRVGRNPVFREN